MTNSLGQQVKFVVSAAQQALDSRTERRFLLTKFDVWARRDPARVDEDQPVLL